MKGYVVSNDTHLDIVHMMLFNPYWTLVPLAFYLISQFYRSRFCFLSAFHVERSKNEPIYVGRKLTSIHAHANESSFSCVYMRSVCSSLYNFRINKTMQLMLNCVYFIICRPHSRTENNVDLRVDYRLMSTLNIQSTYTQAKATKSFSCLYERTLQLFHLLMQQILNTKWIHSMKMDWNSVRRCGCSHHRHFPNHLYRWNVFVWGQIHRHKFRFVRSIRFWMEEKSIGPIPWLH